LTSTLPYHYTSEVHLSSVACAGGLTEVSIMLENAQLAIANALVLINKLLNKLSQFLLCTKWIDEGLFSPPRHHFLALWTTPHTY